MPTGFRPSRLHQVVRVLALVSVLANSSLLARGPRSVTFSEDPNVCVLEWTSTGMANDFSVYQLYANGRFESRTYLNGPKPVPDSHTTTDLTPDELAIWLDDIVESGLYAYSRSDIDRRIAATGRVRTLVNDGGTVGFESSFNSRPESGRLRRRSPTHSLAMAPGIRPLAIRRFRSSPPCAAWGSASMRQRRQASRIPSLSLRLLFRSSPGP